MEEGEKGGKRVEVMKGEEGGKEGNEREERGRWRRIMKGENGGKGEGGM